MRAGQFTLSHRLSQVVLVRSLGDKTGGNSLKRFTKVRNRWRAIVLKMQ